MWYNWTRSPYSSNGNLLGSDLRLINYSSNFSDFTTVYQDDNSLSGKACIDDINSYKWREVISSQYNFKDSYNYMNSINLDELNTNIAYCEWLEFAIEVSNTILYVSYTFYPLIFSII